MPLEPTVETELIRLGDRMDAFILGQAEFNRQINENIKMLSQTHVQSQTQQIEINNLTQQVSSLSNKLDKSNESISVVKENQAVLMEFKKEVIFLKRWVAGLFGSIVLMVVAIILK
jgi:septal ring factor EnvC (AmiA/AmiB activator)